MRNLFSRYASGLAIHVYVRLVLHLVGHRAPTATVARGWGGGRRRMMREGSCAGRACVWMPTRAGVSHDGHGTARVGVSARMSAYGGDAGMPCMRDMLRRRVLERVAPPMGPRPMTGNRGMERKGNGGIRTDGPRLGGFPGLHCSPQGASAFLEAPKCLDRRPPPSAPQMRLRGRVPIDACGMMMPAAPGTRPPATPAAAGSILRHDDDDSRRARDAPLPSGKAAPEWDRRPLCLPAPASSAPSCATHLRGNS